MSSPTRRHLLSERRLTVPTAAHVLTTLGHRLADEEREVAKTLEASLAQLYGRDRRGQRRVALNDAPDRIRDALRYRVMLAALLDREVTPRDVHLLLNTGREPRVPLGRIERGTLLLTVGEDVALAVVWRLNCEPFLQMRPERRREVASLINARLLDRVRRGPSLFLYYLPARSVIVGSAREEKRLGPAALTAFCLPLSDFVQDVFRIVSEQARIDKTR